MDWDKQVENYANNVMGPFAAEMTAPGADGNCRNLLLNRIRQSPPGFFKPMQIADYGCGPGNLLGHVSGIFDKVYGIDFRHRGLEIAAERAKKLAVKFFPVHADIRTYAPAPPYDLITSVNSILPPEREAVAGMLAGIRRSLAPEGRFWAIMPSFDTVEHYLQCMQEEWAARFGAEEVERRIAAFKAARKFDPATLSYADDGINAQCFHTPESIARDFEKAGLVIREPLRKVYYPWELTKRFDYGFFPGKEEIWDWFVAAGAAGA